MVFDPDLTSRRVSIELTNVTIEQALDIISLEAKSFWKPVTNEIIFVAPDQGLASVIMQRLNPVTPILMATRDLIFPGSGGTRGELVAASAFAIGLFFAGLVFHRIAMPVVIDRANS